MGYRDSRPGSPYQSTIWADEIDYTNSLTAGLIFCTFPPISGIMRNMIGGEIAVAGTVSGAELPGIGISVSGPAFIGTDLTHPDADFDNPATKYGTVDQYTLMVTAHGRTSTGNPQCLMDMDNKSTERVFQFRITDAFASPEFIAFDTTGAANTVTSSIGYVAGVERMWTQIGVIDSVSDGIRITAGFAGETPATSLNTTTGKSYRSLTVASKLTLFNVLGSTEQQFLGDIYLACIWRRPLTIPEQMQLVQEPFQFLKPAVRRAAMTAAVGGGARSRGLIIQ